MLSDGLAVPRPSPDLLRRKRIIPRSHSWLRVIRSRAYGCEVDLLDLIEGLRRLFPRAAAVMLIVGFAFFPAQSSQLLSAVINQRAGAINRHLTKAIARVLHTSAARPARQHK